VGVSVPVVVLVLDDLRALATRAAAPKTTAAKAAMFKNDFFIIKIF
jgi:hypothetical protein